MLLHRADTLRKRCATHALAPSPSTFRRSLIWEPSREPRRIPPALTTKLGPRNRAQLVVLAHQTGLCCPTEIHSLAIENYPESWMLPKSSPA